MEILEPKTEKFFKNIALTFVHLYQNHEILKKFNI